jgi:hypothetical protein
MGPVTMEVLALLGRGACFKAPFSNSISSACRPTIRSSAAILASYSCSRSAACTSPSSAPASNLPTQIRISCREMSCRCARACSVAPAGRKRLLQPRQRHAVGLLPVEDRLDDVGSSQREPQRARRGPVDLLGRAEFVDRGAAPGLPPGLRRECPLQFLQHGLLRG